MAIETKAGNQDLQTRQPTRRSNRTAPVVEGTCPMPDIAQLIGGKWKLIILQILIFQGMKRFNELRRQIHGITQTMLTNQLRALERDGLVSRKIYPEVPPRVEYTATQRALDLEAMFKAMHAWWVKDEKAGSAAENSGPKDD